jgi:hypothetical protein
MSKYRLHKQWSFQCTQYAHFNTPIEIRARSLAGAGNHCEGSVEQVVLGIGCAFICDFSKLVKFDWSNH